MNIFILIIVIIVTFVLLFKSMYRYQLTIYNSSCSLFLNVHEFKTIQSVVFVVVFPPESIFYVNPYCFVFVSLFLVEKHACVFTEDEQFKFPHCLYVFDSGCCPCEF